MHWTLAKRCAYHTIVLPAPSHFPWSTWALHCNPTSDALLAPPHFQNFKKSSCIIIFELFCIVPVFLVCPLFWMSYVARQRNCNYLFTIITIYYPKLIIERHWWDRICTANRECSCEWPITFNWSIKRFSVDFSPTTVVIRFFFHYFKLSGL